MPGKLSKKKCIDSGIVLALLLILMGLILNQTLLFKISIGILILTIIYPIIFKPFAYLWFGLAKILGLVVPKILLTIIFFVFVYLVGIIWKLIGKDPLKLNQWKRDDSSVMETVNHTYTQEDLKDPY